MLAELISSEPERCYEVFRNFLAEEYEPNMRQKVPWNGATKRLSPQKAMILLSLRGKGEDKFWFSFFREAGHVLYDNRKDILINDGSKDDLREVRADEFAAKFLIPPEYDRRIRTFSPKMMLCA